MPVLSWASTKNENFLKRFILLFKKSDSGKKEFLLPESYDLLEKSIGYFFKSKELLKQALTHKSAVASEDNNTLLSNERLEFLGDAVLNCLVTEYLYIHYQDRTEGQLSKIKSLVVSRKILGEVAEKIKLGRYILFGPSEEKTGGRTRISTLSNTFEALIGAVYLDGGLECARRILRKCLFKRIPQFLDDESNINYKSKILELSQRDGFGVPHYSTLEAKGPEHAKTFTVQIEVGGVVLGKGSGSNKKIAQQQAAREAVEKYDKEFILSSLKGEKKDELVSN
ncbi:MAG: ribonuclease III [Chitinispirillaceae bacterium]|nr:ribonuclease III [Chitinispirillaceae bacterium]